MGDYIASLNFRDRDAFLVSTSLVVLAWVALAKASVDRRGLA